MTTYASGGAPTTVRTRTEALRTSEAMVRGISRSELDSDAFVQARHGVHVPAGVPLDDPDVRIAVAAAGLPPTGVVGGWAAARVHELAAAARRADDRIIAFDGVEHWPPGSRELEPLLVCAPRTARIERAAMTRVFRSDLDDDEIVVVGGSRVTSPLRTAFDLARLRRYEAAIVGLDRLRSLDLVDAEALGELLEQRRRWRGVGQARRVLRDSSDRVESPRESVLRLMWLRTGLGQPLANPVVRSLDGQFVARVDLVDPATGIVGEYDGEHHAAASRRSDDARRQEALEGLGLHVIRATAADVATAGARSAWETRLRHLYRRVSRTASVRRWQLGYQ